MDEEIPDKYSTQNLPKEELLKIIKQNITKSETFWKSPQNKLFITALIMIAGWFGLVFFGTKLGVDSNFVEKSFELVKFVVSAWIGSIIGGRQK